MRLVVTGREGQVARSLIERARSATNVEVIALGRPELDLARPATVTEALAAARPDLIVSAAAYTAVDLAEDEPELAFAINCSGAGAVAKSASKIGVPVIHLSTDYVFDGQGEQPYDETVEPAPRSVYGLSKLAGEKAVAAANTHHLILRTAWLHSPFGRNFVKTMLTLAGQKTEIPVVADQWGNPTSALDIADAILRIASELQRGGDGKLYGLYHLAGTGVTNWSGLARHVMATSRQLGGPSAAIRDIATADYPTKAQRPAYSCLSSEKFGKVFGWTAPAWEHSVSEVVTRLCRA